MLGRIYTFLLCLPIFLFLLCDGSKDEKVSYLDICSFGTVDTVFWNSAWPPFYGDIKILGNYIVYKLRVVDETTRRMTFRFRVVRLDSGAEDWYDLQEEQRGQVVHDFALTKDGSLHVAMSSGELLEFKDEKFVRSTKLEIPSGYHIIDGGLGPEVNGARWISIVRNDVNTMSERVFCAKENFYHARFDRKGRLRGTVPVFLGDSLCGKVFVGSPHFFLLESVGSDIVAINAFESQAAIYTNERLKGILEMGSAINDLNEFSYDSSVVNLDRNMDLGQGRRFLIRNKYLDLFCNGTSVNVLMQFQGKDFVNRIREGVFVDSYELDLVLASNLLCISWERGYMVVLKPLEAELFSLEKLPLPNDLNLTL